MFSTPKVRGQSCLPGRADGQSYIPTDFGEDFFGNEGQCDRRSGTIIGDCSGAVFRQCGRVDGRVVEEIGNSIFRALF